MSVEHGEQYSGQKPLPYFLPAYMTAAPYGVVPHAGKRHIRAPTLLCGFLWVKILSSSWTSDSGALSVVPFLEASSLDTYPSPWHFWFISHGRSQSVAAISLLGKVNGFCLPNM